MDCLPKLGEAFKAARKDRYPKDRLEDFACRISVGRATLQKMDKGDLSVSIASLLSSGSITQAYRWFRKALLYREKLIR